MNRTSLHSADLLALTPAALQMTADEVDAEYRGLKHQTKCVDKGTPPHKDNPMRELPCYLCGSTDDYRVPGIARMCSAEPYDAIGNGCPCCERCHKARGSVSYRAFCSLMRIVHGQAGKRRWDDDLPPSLLLSA